MNVLTIVGNLGGDCRTNNVGGSPVCNFSVAMQSGYGQNKQTHWVDCAYWGKGGEAVSQYLTKGQKVAVSGELSMKAASGNYPAGFALRVNSLTLCVSAGGNTGHSTAPVPSTTDDVLDDSDVPF
jgi:single-strand DNA-binding protein